MVTEDSPSIILVLDPANSTGYALVSVSTNRKLASIYEYGFLEVDTTSDFSGDWCLDLQRQLRKIIRDHMVEHIAMEDFFFSKRFANGSKVNVELRTAIAMLARELGLKYTILSITEWKKYIAGRSTPTKEQKKQWGTKSKKLMIQQALWERKKIRFPNHSLSKKTGKPIAFRMDIVDVVAQSIYFCGIYLHIPEVICDVEIPKDVVIKNNGKVFEY